MYRLITSAKNSDDLSIGFDRDRKRWQQELIKIKFIKGEFHLRIMLKDDFRFAEHQEKASFGLGSKLALTKKDNADLHKAVILADDRIKIDHFLWYVFHCMPYLQEQSILSKQILNKTPTRFRYIEICFYKGNKKSECMEFRIR